MGLASEFLQPLATGGLKVWVTAIGRISSSVGKIVIVVIFVEHFDRFL